MSATTAARLRLRVEGTVQGVGFRPHVYRLAAEERLAGWVRNDARGVVCEVEGDPQAVERFADRIRAEAPPLALVERVRSEARLPEGAEGFAILASDGSADPDAAVSADAATCAACLAEVRDPANRRHRYPFTNCTDCGPRFTIVLGVPYDRPATTMAGFSMCPACRAEYDDPLDRRFHAQPNACPACGPSLALLDAAGRPLPAEDPLAAAGAALRDGKGLAVKGLGGYHLVCRADHAEAAAALRARKHREDKPFALMAGDVDAARALVELGPEEETLLTGRERPIVIARRLPGAGVAEAVAPASPDLGVMLPYTPLHHLLLDEAGGPLVMTSANVSDEPIAYRDDDARERLRGIADGFLVHDRPIHVRTDDSVVRATACGPMLVRRSRGYVPASVPLPVAARRPLLACGAEQKSTFCLARESRAWVSHHIGDLENWETLRSFREGVEHFRRLFDVAPELVVHDLHPEYLSTKEAQEADGVDLLGVQHHHAHLAACLAEHGEAGPAVGAIYDGTGYGTDATVWGGELLVGGLTGFERAAHLWPVALPGGAAAVREPWRMACAWLEAAGVGPEAPPAALAGAVDERRWRQVASLAPGGPGTPLTTSMGRLFDAVAALCGLRAQTTYEGQAAVELEARATRSGDRGAYPLPLSGSRLDARQTIEAVRADLQRGTDIASVAARFHAGVARGTADAVVAVAGSRGLDLAVLSGGVFANRLLLERTRALLERAGMRVLHPRLLPPNDGGIAYGQAAIGAARDA
jgi:hydrogenase maturation protein HypF